jgi:predicted ATPase
MRRCILTGTPGSGKTSILRLLERLGHGVVEEAATDVIALARARGDAEPHLRASFIDDIVVLQRQRQERAPAAGTPPQFHDRSPICTYALATWLGRPASAALRAEIDRIEREHIYDPAVFFVRAMGFCEPTAARRISYADSLDFERVHEETYRSFGYDLVHVAAAPLSDRAAAILHVAFGFSETAARSRFAG